MLIDSVPPDDFANRNLLTVARVVHASALAREESRGSHYRMEYPDHDDKKFLKHSVNRADKVVFVP